MCFCKRYQSTCIQSISYTLVNPAVMQLSASSDVCVCVGGGGGGGGGVQGQPQPNYEAN